MWCLLSNSLFFSSVSFFLSNLIMWLASATYCLGTILVVGLIFLEAPFPVGTLFWKTNWDGIEEVKQKLDFFSSKIIFTKACLFSFNSHSGKLGVDSWWGLNVKKDFLRKTWTTLYMLKLKKKKLIKTRSSKQCRTIL